MEVMVRCWSFWILVLVFGLDFELCRAQKKYYYSTKSVKEYVVPVGVEKLTFKLWGGGGAGGSSTAYAVSGGGAGGFTTGTIAVTSGQYVYIAVGSKGMPRSMDYQSSLGNTAWPNGGSALAYQGGGGGGRSQVSVFNSAQSDFNAAIRIIDSIRMIAAGGGGGSSSTSKVGGGGGGLSGATVANSFPGTQTGSGTCSSGCSCTGISSILGSSLQGGHGCGGGGGGDGWYGGSGAISTSTIQLGGGSGGSGYLHPSVILGVTSVGNNNGGYPSNSNDIDNLNNYGKGGAGTFYYNFITAGSSEYNSSVAFGQDGLVVMSYECGRGYLYNSTSLNCELESPNVKPGYYLVSGVSTICPANSYCLGGSTSSIIQCPFPLYSSPGSFDQSNCSIPLSVNFSVNISNLSFSENDLQNYMAQRNDLDLNFNFTFAQKSNVFVEAQACPAGYVCPVDSTSTIACVKGTYNNETNAFASSQCATCPVGFYCPVASVNPTRCPDYTTSVEGQDSVLQCTCLAGFYCKYAKRIYGRVTLNISAAAFDETMQSNFRKAIAAAAGVTESDVLILSVNSGTGGGGSRRRMLSLGSSLLEEQGKPFGESFMDVHIQVLNAEGLRDIKKHVDMHCGAGYHVDHEWRENHGVVAVPSLS
jgi:hypothetical protein